MAFTGFGEHAIDFYDGLEVDNSKSYWEDNKHTYAADVRAPMEALLAELSPEFAEEGCRVTVFRPYRDVRFASGCFHLESDQLARFRAAVAEDLHGLEGIVARLAKAGWEIKGDRLKARPRGYDADHPRIELLKHRSLYAMRVWEPDDALHERETFHRVRKAFRALRPINEWARDHVGVSDVPRR
ncbi:MAG: DUF2461 domain-containing protein [Pseudonocardiaceae bacterium]|nr:DUF2461 domain-containing protein [Pseudonocardiaceae bacterium]